MADESSNTIKMTTNSKRLFIGGLHDGISKEDLRMKFEPFGHVKDVEVISHKDDSGMPLKTFAYINIDISEKDFKKCVTMYNNCNWKGNVLKVQMAKEDFLSRLQKEKNKKTKVRKNTDILQNFAVKDMRSAVPGTLVPQKRNWVIGKFGRALPILFLRRKDGKKIAKFDPSKTVHCVKKICVNDDQSQSVENLTWNIENGSSLSSRSLGFNGNLNDADEFSKKQNSNKRSMHYVKDEGRTHFKFQKITGSKALSWLGMDSSSDEDKNNEDEAFGWKEHFNGKAGVKLMKLHQKFGHDQRFQMDERFLESDEELDSDPKTDFDNQTEKRPSFDVSNGDDIDQQLKEEKQLSLKVLQKVLGSNSVFSGEDEDSRNQYRDSSTIRYDPSRGDHAKFEEKVERSVSPEMKESNVPKKILETKPEVSESKFYTVSGSLKDFFGNGNEGGNTFSFFSDSSEDKDRQSKEIKLHDKPNILELEKITKWKAPLQLVQNLPYDSSATESEGENEGPGDSKGVTSGPKTFHKRHIFYHVENREMMKTLEEESSSFMRKESEESLRKYWAKVRRSLTQDYKRKRKNALRRQKKVSHKRSAN